MIVHHCATQTVISIFIKHQFDGMMKDVFGSKDDFFKHMWYHTIYTTITSIIVEGEAAAVIIWYWAYCPCVYRVYIIDKLKILNKHPCKCIHIHHLHHWPAHTSERESERQISITHTLSNFRTSKENDVSSWLLVHTTDL